MKKQALAILVSLSAGCSPQLHPGEESYRDRRNPVSATIPDDWHAENQRILGRMSSADLQMKMNRSTLGVTILKPSGQDQFIHNEIATPIASLKGTGRLIAPFSASVYLYGALPDSLHPDDIESRCREIRDELSALGATQLQFVCNTELGYMVEVYKRLKDE